MIPYGRQSISHADIEAVVSVLRSDFLTQGPIVSQFETALAERVQAAHAVAVNSATSALHIACLALGLGTDDWLWTTPITFVASANCGRFCGAEVDFVDIEPDTFNMCPEALARKLEHAARNNVLPKVIVPVHMGGQSPDMERISALARTYGIKVIEDASHAIGAAYQGRPVGNSAHSDITVFSFHPVKIITTGEGGMATTNDPGLAACMQRLRSHGITRDVQLMTHAPDGPWYYQQLELGWNYRMTELQAALGLSQLSRLDNFIHRRNELADRYDMLLEGLPIDLPGRQVDARSAFHLYIVRLREYNPDRHREVFETLRAAGIGVNLHYIPVHLQPYYRALGFSGGDYPVAEDYYGRAISIPIFADLDYRDQDRIVAELSKAVEN